jgi:hypothetical protein
MTLHFYLDLQRPKQGEFPVICRITLDRKKTEFQLPFLTCITEGWDKPAPLYVPLLPEQLKSSQNINLNPTNNVEIMKSRDAQNKQFSIIHGCHFALEEYPKTNLIPRIDEQPLLNQYIYNYLFLFFKALSFN